MLLKSVVAPPVLFTVGAFLALSDLFIAEATSVGLRFSPLTFVGLGLLGASGRWLRWAVAKSFLFDRPPLVVSAEGLLLAEMVNVGYTPWREVSPIEIDVAAERFRCQVAKNGYWLAVSLDLGNYEIDDLARFRQRVLKLQATAGSTRLAEGRLAH